MQAEFVCSERSLCLGQSAGVPDGHFDVSPPLVPAPSASTVQSFLLGLRDLDVLGPSLAIRLTGRWLLQLSGSPAAVLLHVLLTSGSVEWK